MQPGITMGGQGRKWPCFFIESFNLLSITGTFYFFFDHYCTLRMKSDTKLTFPCKNASIIQCVKYPLYIFEHFFFIVFRSSRIPCDLAGTAMSKLLGDHGIPQASIFEIKSSLVTKAVGMDFDRHTRGKGLFSP